jgi:uncharacterized protein YndB with AHSA1/START domain
MAHPFEVRKEIEVDATPEQIWEAITTGRGIDGWFLDTGNEVEPGEGGRVRLNFGGEVGESRITVWEPPHRFAHRSGAAPDGSLHAFEYVIEAQGADRAIVRLVHSGFLADDWEAEYDALNEGDFMYLHLLAQYVKHFFGRPVTAVSVWRPDEPDRERVLGVFRRGLGLPATIAQGDPVRTELDGVGAVDGVIDFVSPGIIGVRTDDALYRFLHTPQRVAYLGHHIYRDGLDADATRQAWQAWLDRSFA